MFLGRVLGTLVSTIKYTGLEGVKLQIVQPLNHKLEPSADPLVAVDAMQSGQGELVFLEDGREAAMTLPVLFVPVDAAVVGIVDMVNTVDGTDWKKSDEN